MIKNCPPKTQVKHKLLETGALSQKRAASLRSEPFLLAHPYDHHLEMSVPMWVGVSDDIPECDSHMHRGLELGLMVSGTLEVGSPRYETRAIPGDVWIFPMWERHSWSIAAAGVRMVAMVFLSQLLQNIPTTDVPWVEMYATPPEARPRITTTQARQRIITLGKELIREHESQEPGWTTAVQLLLIQVLLVLGREWKRTLLEPQQQISCSDIIGRIAPALDLVHPEQGQCASVQEAAIACSLSPSRFHYLFREAMGLSYGEYCLRARLIMAARLLDNTDRPIDTIAKQLDFADGSHLHRRFLAQYGCTPSEYRRRSGVVANRI
jgi:AraC-like DNA-binding protein